MSAWQLSGRCRKSSFFPISVTHQNQECICRSHKEAKEWGDSCVGWRGLKWRYWKPLGVLSLLCTIGMWGLLCESLGFHRNHLWLDGVLKHRGRDEARTRTRLWDIPLFFKRPDCRMEGNQQTGKRVDRLFICWMIILYHFVVLSSHCIFSSVINASHLIAFQFHYNECYYFQWYQQTHVVFFFVKTKWSMEPGRQLAELHHLQSK